eukprot:gnl/TRDRNA2_/TRDRNA2_129850_c0_seq1.p1 gnl/TRDRNA2_/TRDRNA2_129850_c0~~gnl/TRDRNA2_/TRDRNA2_129850_c0_seq1.p1  ORF type:complete len:128 (-),score=38.74 gnl/TRDRNA2_/TRDRNA2_129850_c0_seq1:163-546(-)
MVWLQNCSLLLFLLWQGRALAESADDCLNVEDPDGAAAEGKAGDRQCFGGDEVGMACGWDGTPQESYCELSATGLKVCARRRGGGRCVAGNRTPYTDKIHDNEKKFMAEQQMKAKKEKKKKKQRKEL